MEVVEMRRVPRYFAFGRSFGTKHSAYKEIAKRELRAQMLERAKELATADPKAAEQCAAQSFYVSLAQFIGNELDLKPYIRQAYAERFPPCAHDYDDEYFMDARARNEFLSYRAWELLKEVTSAQIGNPHE